MTTTIRTSRDRLPRVSMIPLLRLVDDVGIIEHSNGPIPDPTQGHCTDDAGRALGLAARLPKDLASPEIALRCLAQLQRSITAPGHFALRLDVNGHPTEHPESDDATARAIWGLSLAATSQLPRLTRDWATELLRGFRSFQSPHPRAAAYAIIAGCSLIDAKIDQSIGEDLLLRNVQFMPRGALSRSWGWPEPSLSYGNALLADSLLYAGRTLGNRQLITDGLDQLAWLLDRETSPAGHFSFTPVGKLGDLPHSALDQQPLEAWTTAAACTTALSIDADRVWAEAIVRAADWFAGRNDRNVPMWDHENGSSFDGLTVDGVNRNEGAESTLAFIGTLLELEEIQMLSSSSPIKLRWPKATITDA